MSQFEDSRNENKSNYQSLIQRQIAFASSLFQADVTTHILLESLAEAAVVLDKTGTILLVNKRAEEMFGYTRTEFIGMAHDRILPVRFHENHKKHVQDYFANPRIRPMGIGMDLIALKKNEIEFPVEISLSYVNTENNFFVIAFISDISLRKQAEDALRVRNDALDAFAHTLAHDIRNSIAVINGFGTYIDDNLNDLSEQEVHDSVRTIISTGKKVTKIIESLLQFSTISREDVPFAPVEMKTVLNSALERLKEQISESNANLIIPDRFPVVSGYGSWIEEIWFNYISNAIKYGGDPPIIEIGYNVSSDGIVAFWVKTMVKCTPELQTSILTSTSPGKTNREAMDSVYRLLKLWKNSMAA